jgi:hypothetical protein
MRKGQQRAGLERRREATQTSHLSRLTILLLFGKKTVSFVMDTYMDTPSILKDFPLFAARITFADLIEILPRQKPRY